MAQKGWETPYVSCDLRPSIRVELFTLDALKSLCPPDWARVVRLRCEELIHIFEREEEDIVHLGAGYSGGIVGVLWIIDELHRCNLTIIKIICEALSIFSTDETMSLSQRQVMAYLKRYKKMK